MIYFVAPTKATHGILSYDHAKSVDYSLFLEGVSLRSITAPMVFNVKKDSDLKKLSKLHFIRSTGPDLVSRHLREVIESVAPSEVEFFDASIEFGDQKIGGFSCLNALWKLPCIDMEASEYELANFDPNSPEYTFQYLVLRDRTDPPVQVARCEEQPRKLVVGDAIKAACISNGLTGLDFCRAEDLTYKDRTICESI
ncbi:imm11 family protein [Burkholderia pseudomultivorans]|uniref:imm11 family protein n=1 Tax=Burkholderia pseudomultivorans TaxID=1207504 RepID=UPI00188EB76A|nr:DUF1629 domain-containing protein [Burkholderia pseudomultivorans]MBF5012707.1 hypothetical protein [Burkholderia pseudomultivorans]